jgi:hypothetical protein
MEETTDLGSKARQFLKIRNGTPRQNGTTGNWRMASMRAVDRDKVRDLCRK